MDSNTKIVILVLIKIFFINVEHFANTPTEFKIYQ